MLATLLIKIQKFIQNPVKHQRFIIHLFIGLINYFAKYNILKYQVANYTQLIWLVKVCRNLSPNLFRRKKTRNLLRRKILRTKKTRKYRQLKYGEQIPKKTLKLVSKV